MLRTVCTLNVSVVNVKCPFYLCRAFLMAGTARRRRTRPKGGTTPCWDVSQHILSFMKMNGKVQWKLHTPFVLFFWTLSDDRHRVKLHPLLGDPNSDYINANYIDVSLSFCHLPHEIQIRGQHLQSVYLPHPKPQSISLVPVRPPTRLLAHFHLEAIIQSSILLSSLPDAMVLNFCTRSLTQSNSAITFIKRE